MARKTNANIRESILDRYELRLEKKRIVRSLPKDTTGLKNSLMLYVEARHRLPIEILIWQGNCKQVAQKLEISADTISNWRKKFPNKSQYIEWMKVNSPYVPKNGVKHTSRNESRTHPRGSST